MSETVLAAEEVTVRRAGRTILDGVDLSVPPASRILIQGTSGAGKTTLFEVLGLLAVPDDGRVLVDGTDATAASERQRARLRRETIGVVYQEFRLIPDLTARENAAVPMTHAGEVDEEWLDRLFDRLGITRQATQYPPTLSGGEKQRVAIARALSNRPTVVLADEPTGQLDDDTADVVLELLFELQADTGTALVVVSHDRRLGERFEAIRRLGDGTLSDGPDEESGAGEESRSGEDPDSGDDSGSGDGPRATDHDPGSG